MKVATDVSLESDAVDADICISHEVADQDGVGIGEDEYPLELINDHKENPRRLCICRQWNLAGRRLEERNIYQAADQEPGNKSPHKPGNTKTQENCNNLNDDLDSIVQKSTQLEDADLAGTVNTV